MAQTRIVAVAILLFQFRYALQVFCSETGPASTVKELDGKDVTFSKDVINDTNHNSVILMYSSSNENSAHLKQAFWELSTTIQQKFPSVVFFAVDLSVSETFALSAIGN